MQPAPLTRELDPLTFSGGERFLIYIYGTSHVSQDSIELIEEKFEEHDPEIVALELDFVRLNSLLSGDTGGNISTFGRLIKYFQQRIGKKTGVMPGEEMLHAYKKAGEEEIEVALIDQDIRVTMERLKSVRRKEKVKAVFSLVAGMLFSGRFNIEEIPEDEQIVELLDKVEEKYPGIYRVLIEERNRYMATALMELQEDNPDKDIVAFVGAGHKEELKKILYGL